MSSNPTSAESSSVHSYDALCSRKEKKHDMRASRIRLGILGFLWFFLKFWKNHFLERIKMKPGTEREGLKETLASIHVFSGGIDSIPGCIHTEQGFNPKSLSKGQQARILLCLTFHSVPEGKEPQRLFPFLRPPLQQEKEEENVLKSWNESLLTLPPPRLLSSYSPGDMEGEIRIRKVNYLSVGYQNMFSEKADYILIPHVMFPNIPSTKLKLLNLDIKIPTEHFCSPPTRKPPPRYKRKLENIHREGGGMRCLPVVTKLKPKAGSCSLWIFLI